MAREKTPKKKQTEIPGTERKTNKKLDVAILAYVEARDERMELTKQEVAAKEDLRSLMTQAAEKQSVPLEEFVYKFVDGEVEHTCRMPPLGDPLPKVKTRDLTA